MLSGRGVLEGRDVYNPQRELGAGNTLGMKAPTGVLRNLIVTPFQGCQVVGATLLRLTPEEVIDVASFQATAAVRRLAPAAVFNLWKHRDRYRLMSAAARRFCYNADTFLNRTEKLPYGRQG